jgi:5-methylcytosine-specific restriction endonuclease McrA
MRYTKSQKNEMVRLKKAGLTLKEIAVRLGINNLTTVRNVCTEAGMPSKAYAGKQNYSAGQRFNNFVIIGKAIHKRSKTGRQYSNWECRCDCSKLFFITTKQIHRGQKSCGCLSVSGRFNKGISKDVIGNSKLNHYINAAKRRNINWALSKEKFIELLFSNCHYCGSPPFTLVKVNSHTLMVNGVDRIDSGLEYCEGNCVACCKFCNRAKGDATIKEFLDWVSNLKGLRK